MEVTIAVSRNDNLKGSQTNIHIYESGLKENSPIKQSDKTNKTFKLTLSNDNIDKKTLGELTRQLARLGYSLECINFLISKYKIKSLEEALQIICIDPETGNYPHMFFPQSKLKEPDSEIKKNKEDGLENLCIVCKDVKEKRTVLSFL